MPVNAPGSCPRIIRRVASPWRCPQIGRRRRSLSVLTSRRWWSLCQLYGGAAPSISPTFKVRAQIDDPLAIFDEERPVAGAAAFGEEGWRDTKEACCVPLVEGIVGMHDSSAPWTIHPCGGCDGQNMHQLLLARFREDPRLIRFFPSDFPIVFCAVALR
jgi:hypothetical protein